MKALKFLLVLLLIPLIGFSQNYEEKVTQEVINGQEVTVVWTTAKKVVKAKNQPNVSTTKAALNQSSAKAKTPVKPMTKEEALAWVLKIQGINFPNPKPNK